MINFSRRFNSLLVITLSLYMQMASASSWNTDHVKYDNNKVTLSGSMAREVLELLKDLNLGVDQYGFRNVYPKTCTVQQDGTCKALDPIASCKLDRTSCTLSSDFANADYISDMSACYSGVLGLKVNGYSVYFAIKDHPEKYHSIDTISGGAGGSEGSGSSNAVLRIHGDGILYLKRGHFQSIAGDPISAVANCRQPAQFID
jgi:hypothetical protein